MPLVDELKQVTMTDVVNKVKSPNIFLTRLLFSRTRTLPTETINIDTVTRDRQIAPFVRKNGEAIMVPNRDAKGYAVEAPNIRIKRPMSASELLFNRRPGGVLFNPSADDVASNVQQHIADDMADMADMVSNAEEYLVSLALQGTISYEVADEEVFTITFPRPGANNITLSTFWDDGTPADTRPLKDTHTAKKVISDASAPPLTDAICGTEATDSLLELAESGNLPALKTTSGIAAGQIEFVNRFRDDGAMFIGELGGIRYWSYGRTADLNGSTKNMIRPKYVEFVSASSAAQRVLYYGAIPDMAALQGRLFVGRRYSKSWEQNDPSAVMALVHSRPLPVPRRLDTWVSMKVVSG